MVSTRLVSSSFAVLLLKVPPRAQPFLKVGVRAPVPYGVGAPYERLRANSSFGALMKVNDNCVVVIST